MKHLAAVRGEDGILRAGEIVVRWDGWSLAVDRPVIVESPTDPFSLPPERRAPYELRWRFGVPAGSLPRLRFGHAYQLRIRVADIAGGGPRPEDAGDAGATDEIMYRRVEPVLPPRLDLDAAPLPGAAVDRLVIRSDRGITAAQFRASEPRYAAEDQCLLFPPTVTFELIEQHGVFDGLDDAESWELARRAIVASDGESTAVALPDPAAEGVAVSFDPGGDADPLWAGHVWGDWPDLSQKAVALGDSPVGGLPLSFDWESAEHLRIHLAQATEADVDLSSTVPRSPRNYLKDFAVYEWLIADTLDVDEHDVTASKLETGRHPMLSPPVTVHVVHAVRRPLLDPVWQPPEVRRVAGDTGGAVDTGFKAGGLSLESTGRLEVSADWDEWDDERMSVASRPLVHAQELDRDEPPDLRFRHEFGDTKHRDIRYTVTGFTRFRSYFHPDEPDSAFQASAEQAVVVMPSTQAPPPLTVLGAVPSFEWEIDESTGAVDHWRRSNRISLELARPWHLTGAGECLALIVAPSAPGVAVTELAGDPVLASERIDPRPPPSWFVGDAVELEVPGVGAVTVVPAPVRFDGERWWADVELDLPDDVRAYRPFIRLAVARYQPDSLPGFELSPIVTVELVQVLPDRSIHLEDFNGSVAVDVDGVSPQPANRIDVELQEWTGRPGAETDGFVLLDGAGEDVPGWRQVPGHVASGECNGPSVRIDLPATGRPLRVQILETEGLRDLGAELAVPGDGSDSQRRELTARVVLVDHIAIPPSWHR
ncbi:hypothetical protein [Micropruina sp.]|uniref:hypothetical protein n=1 Tax=Micropruina sp. TaxID=2737536 RepID=UPI0039E5AE97